MNSQSDSLDKAYFENSDNHFEIAKTIVAFSNTNGGLIYIGVNQKQKVKGVIPKNVLDDLKIVQLQLVKGIISLNIDEILESNKYYFKLSVHKTDKPGAQAIEEKTNKYNAYIFVENQIITAPMLLQYAWKYKGDNGNPPLTLTSEEEIVLNLISENSKLTITQLHKKSNLSMNQIEYITVRLINWNFIRLTSTLEASFLERV